MSDEQEKDQKWTMPFNIGYEAFQLILKALFQQKADANPVAVARIGSIAGLNPKTISSNMTFLKAINVVKGEKGGYQLTPLGVDYAKALYMDDKKTIQEKSLEIIKNSHLQNLAAKLELKKSSITLDEIYSFIKGEGRYAEGGGITGMTPPYATGAKTLMHIFDEAGLLPESIDIEVSSESSTTKKKTMKKSSAKSRPRGTTSSTESTKGTGPSAQLPTDSFGRLVARGVGIVDITDNDTFILAKSFMDLIKKKMDEKSKGSPN